MRMGTRPAYTSLPPKLSLLDVKLQVYAVEALSPDPAVGDGQGPWSSPFRDQTSPRGNARWVAHGKPDSKTNVVVSVPLTENEAFALRNNLTNTDGPVDFETRNDPISVRVLGVENR